MTLLAAGFDGNGHQRFFVLINAIVNRQCRAVDAVRVGGTRFDIFAMMFGAMGIIGGSNGAVRISVPENISVSSVF